MKVCFIIGCVIDVLLWMNEVLYDIVFVDVDLDNVIEYVEYGLCLVCIGGFVLVFCVFVGGKVVDFVQCDEVIFVYWLLVQEIQELLVVLVIVFFVGEGLLQLVSFVECD